jgi:hypothetical protein
MEFHCPYCNYTAFLMVPGAVQAAECLSCGGVSAIADYLREPNSGAGQRSGSADRLEPASRIVARRDHSSA